VLKSNRKYKPTFFVSGRKQILESIPGDNQKPHQVLEAPDGKVFLLPDSCSVSLMLSYVFSSARVRGVRTLLAAFWRCTPGSAHPGTAHRVGEVCLCCTWGRHTPHLSPSCVGIHVWSLCRSPFCCLKKMALDDQAPRLACMSAIVPIPRIRSTVCCNDSTSDIRRCKLGIRSAVAM